MKRGRIISFSKENSQQKKKKKGVVAERIGGQGHLPQEAVGGVTSLEKKKEIARDSGEKEKSR